MVHLGEKISIALLFHQVVGGEVGENELLLVTLNALVVSRRDCATSPGSFPGVEGHSRCCVCALRRRGWQERSGPTGTCLVRFVDHHEVGFVRF